MSARNIRQSIQRKSRLVRQARMNLIQRFLKTRNAKSMNDTLARLFLSFILNDKSSDIVIETAGAAEPGQVMTCDAGSRIEDRPQAIAAIGQGILNFPIMSEQSLAGPSHIGIDWRR